MFYAKLFQEYILYQKVFFNIYFIQINFLRYFSYSKILIFLQMYRNLFINVHTHNKNFCKHFLFEKQFLDYFLTLNVLIYF